MTAYAIYTSVRGLTLKRLLEGLLAVLRCAAILLAACEEIAGLSYTVDLTQQKMILHLQYFQF
jgi:hypothetical protein